MSLYDDLPLAPGSSATGWSTVPSPGTAKGKSVKKGPPVPPKPRALQVKQAPIPKNRPQPAATKPKTQKKVTANLTATNAASNQPPLFQSWDDEALENIIDAYDPTKPNDYEEFCRERIAEEKRRRKLEKVWCNNGEDDSEGSESPIPLKVEAPVEVPINEELDGTPWEPEKENVIAPEVPPGKPQQQQQQTNSKKKKNKKRKKDDSGPEPAPLANSIAARMMEKMGWKVGSGLGKDEQGRKEPLFTKKTERGTGIIVDPSNNVVPEPAKKKASIPLAKSCVVLLTNMVGPGEVDDELQQETADECQKYGPVDRCLVHEIEDPGVTPEQAVRIFVKFTREEAALKAYIDLNGRYFAKREVAASFYPEDKFEEGDYLL